MSGNERTGSDADSTTEGGGRDGPAHSASVTTAKTGRTGGPSSAIPGWEFVFLAGLLGFVLSAIAFVGTIVTGGDVVWPVALNAAAALLVIGRVAHRSFVDPDSDVTTVPGAFGTALVLVAAYGGVGALLVAITSPAHGRLDVAGWLGGAAIVAALFGFGTFPLEAVFDAGDGEGRNEPDGEATDPADRP